MDTQHELAISFSRHSLDNFQALIRATDTKTAALVTILVFMGASVAPIAKDAVTHASKGMPVRSYLFCVSGFCFILALGFVLFFVRQVLRPRGARHYKPGSAARILWQDHVTAFADNEVYFNAVASAEDVTLLRNLTDQVFELAHISSEKMNAFQKATSAGTLCFAFWLVNIATALLLLRSQ